MLIFLGDFQSYKLCTYKNTINCPLPTDRLTEKSWVYSPISWWKIRFWPLMRMPYAFFFFFFLVVVGYILEIILITKSTTQQKRSTNSLARIATNFILLLGLDLSYLPILFSTIQSKEANSINGLCLWLMGPMRML